MVHGDSQVWTLKLAFKDVTMGRVKVLGLFSKYMPFIIEDTKYEWVSVSIFYIVPNMISYMQS